MQSVFFIWETSVPGVKQKLDQRHRHAYIAMQPLKYVAVLYFQK